MGMNIEKMKADLANGECVVHNGTIITSEKELPGPVEIATNSPDQARALLAKATDDARKAAALVAGLQAAIEIGDRIKAEADAGKEKDGKIPETPPVPNPLPENQSKEIRIGQGTQAAPVPNGLTEMEGTLEPPDEPNVAVGGQNVEKSNQDPAAPNPSDGDKGENNEK